MEAGMTTTTDIGPVLEALQDLGLEAYEGFNIPEIMITLGEKMGYNGYNIDIYLTREHNREDGGWEAVIDLGGDQVPLVDGPLGDASPTDVRNWVVSLLRDTAVLHAESLVR